jgi:hypothetical protein
MENGKRPEFRLMLWAEVVAFVISAAVPWLDELFDLPTRLFGAQTAPSNIPEAAFESGLILLVGAVVVAITKRAIDRIAYLESFLVMCAWCRRIHVGRDGMTAEKYLEQRPFVRTSHGICEERARALARPEDPNRAP